MPMWRKVSYQEFIEMSGVEWTHSGYFDIGDGIQVATEVLDRLPFVLDTLDDEKVKWLPRDIVVALYEPWAPTSETQILTELAFRQEIPEDVTVEEIRRGAQAAARAGDERVREQSPKRRRERRSSHQCGCSDRGCIAVPEGCRLGV